MSLVFVFWQHVRNRNQLSWATSSGLPHLKTRAAVTEADALVLRRELAELYKWLQLECKATRVAEHFIDLVVKLSSRERVAVWGGSQGADNVSSS